MFETFENLLFLATDCKEKIPQHIIAHETSHNIADFAPVLDTFILEKQSA